MPRRTVLRGIGALSLLLAGCGAGTPAPGPVVGRPMPVLVLPDLAGRPVRAGEPGRPAVLNFWATWCPPCRAEMGSLDRLYRGWVGAGLSVVGISVDSDLNLVREFVLRQGLGFPILSDPGAAVTRGELGIRLFPTTILVRRDGVIAEVVAGERQWDEGPALDGVRALL